MGIRGFGISPKNKFMLLRFWRFQRSRFSHRVGLPSPPRSFGPNLGLLPRSSPVPRCFSLPATSGEPAGGWTGDEGGEKCAICLSQYLPQYLPFSLGREFQVTSKYLVCFLDRSLWPGQKIILIDWMLICHPMKTLHVFLRRKFPNFHLPPLPKNLNNKSCKV